MIHYEENECENLVSIIMPVHNAENFLEESLQSVCNQTYRPIEIVMFNDHSTDDSWSILKRWENKFISYNINPILINSQQCRAQGTGFARNSAMSHSSGRYLCHLDADDIMEATRIQKQYELAKQQGDHCLVGANFNRYPIGSTLFYTDWLNAMNNDDIMLQQYRECTIICPTWFMHRNVYETVSRARGGKGFVEKSSKLTRVPEDLFFFMDHLACGGTLAKVNEELVTYRYHTTSWSMGVKPIDMQKIRIEYLQHRVLDNYAQFSIWGCGRDGKKFLSMLSENNMKKVTCFSDIDPKKIGSKYFCNKIRKFIPIVHFQSIVPPFIVCVASKRAKGELERNVKSLNYKEGVDYLYFC